VCVSIYSAANMSMYMQVCHAQIEMKNIMNG